MLFLALTPPHVTKTCLCCMLRPVGSDLQCKGSSTTGYISVVKKVLVFFKECNGADHILREASGKSPAASSEANMQQRRPRLGSLI